MQCSQQLLTGRIETNVFSVECHCNLCCCMLLRSCSPNYHCRFAVDHFASVNCHAGQETETKEPDHAQLPQVPCSPVWPLHCRCHTFCPICKWVCQALNHQFHQYPRSYNLGPSATSSLIGIDLKLRAKRSLPPKRTSVAEQPVCPLCYLFLSPASIVAASTMSATTLGQTSFAGYLVILTQLWCLCFDNTS